MFGDATLKNANPRGQKLDVQKNLHNVRRVGAILRILPDNIQLLFSGEMLPEWFDDIERPLVFCRIHKPCTYDDIVRRVAFFAVHTIHTGREGVTVFAVKWFYEIIWKSCVKTFSVLSLMNGYKLIQRHGISFPFSLLVAGQETAV